MLLLNKMEYIKVYSICEYVSHVYPHIKYTKKMSVQSKTMYLEEYFKRSKIPLRCCQLKAYSES